MARETQSILLPTLVVTPVDVSRLRREIEALGEYLRQASLRKGGDVTPKLPKTSRMLDELAALNKVNLLQVDERDRLDGGLLSVQHDAPVIHISFSSDPSSAFMNKIIVWFRENINPSVLLSIGLQPTIAAGCIVRTPNHYYDFSLRKRFEAQRNVLVEMLQRQTGTNEVADER